MVVPGEDCVNWSTPSWLDGRGLCPTEAGQRDTPCCGRWNNEMRTRRPNAQLLHIRYTASFFLPFPLCSSTLTPRGAGTENPRVAPARFCPWTPLFLGKHLIAIVSCVGRVSSQYIRLMSTLRSNRVCSAR